MSLTAFVDVVLSELCSAMGDCGDAAAGGEWFSAKPIDEQAGIMRALGAAHAAGALPDDGAELLCRFFADGLLAGAVPMVADKKGLRERFGDICTGTGAADSDQQGQQGQGRGRRGKAGAALDAGITRRLRAEVLGMGAAGGPPSCPGPGVSLGEMEVSLWAGGLLLHGAAARPGVGVGLSEEVLEHITSAGSAAIAYMLLVAKLPSIGVLPPAPAPAPAAPTLAAAAEEAEAEAEEGSGKRLRRSKAADGSGSGSGSAVLKAGSAYLLNELVR
jgi:hypothetical protein